MFIKFFPANTSGFLQPCDLSIFGYVKNKWKTTEVKRLWTKHCNEAPVRLKYLAWIKTLKYYDIYDYYDRTFGALDQKIILQGWKDWM